MGSTMSIDVDQQKLPLWTLTAKVVGGKVGAGVFSIARNFAQATGIYGAIIAFAENKPFVGVVEEAFGLKKLRVVEAGGSDYEASGRNGTAAPTSFCASPGVVYAYDHNTYTNTVLRKEASKSLPS